LPRTRIHSSKEGWTSYWENWCRHGEHALMACSHEKPSLPYLYFKNLLFTFYGVLRHIRFW